MSSESFTAVFNLLWNFQNGGSGCGKCNDDGVAILGNIYCIAQITLPPPLFFVLFTFDLIPAHDEISGGLCGDWAHSSRRGSLLLSCDSKWRVPYMFPLKIQPTILVWEWTVTVGCQKKLVFFKKINGLGVSLDVGRSFDFDNV